MSIAANSVPLLAALALASAARADIPEDRVMVPLFMETCATGEITLAARRAAIEGNGQWTEIPADDLDMARLGQVPAQVPVGHFNRPATVRQWRRTVDGKEVRAILATYERGNYPNVCAIIVPDVANAMGYMSPFRAALRPLGLSGKSTDLPHYQEYSGRLADRRKARADIFSRTRVRGAPRSMHMYIAFE
ncbi:MAG TPA: hypothetical protein VGW40_08550 [Allosphingosinicella sp.]|nr:hypothetical protein [Allosphingosinicella sp.]